MSTDTVKIMHVNLNQVAEFIKASIRHSLDADISPASIMLHSAPGVGKSSIIHQVSDSVEQMYHEAFPDKKYRMIDIRVGAMDAGEIQGVPFLPHNEGLKEGEEFMDLRYSTPQWFPKKDECGILFMDELSNAPIPNQQSCYRVLLDRSIQNGSIMPNQFMIIGAGNRKEDRTSSKGLIPALASRFTTHFYVKVHVPTFTLHAIENGWDEQVVAFLNFEQGALLGKPADDECGYPNPRNWESVSKVKLNPYHPKDMVEAAVYGAVGRETGVAFYGFLEHYKDMPDFDKVEAGKLNDFLLDEKNATDGGLKFALMMSSTYRIINALVREDYFAADQLALLLKRCVDPSTRSMAARVLRDLNSKMLVKILHKRDRCPDVYDMIHEALDRASSFQQ